MYEAIADYYGRFDEWQRMEREFQGKRCGQTALVIGGGVSAGKWAQAADEVGADILLGVNGTIATIGDRLDYWLTTETTAAVRAPWIQTTPNGCIRFSPYKIGNATPETDVHIQRVPYHDHPGMTLREYHHGLMMARYSNMLHCYPGTVMLQAFHLACLMGFYKVYTIGWDLCVRDVESLHHWYDNPKYAESRFTEFKGVYTLPFWMETARWIAEVLKPMCLSEGIGWKDLSDGLIDLVSPEDWTA